MNKAEMAGRLAARTGLSKAIAREAVDGVFAAIGDALANGEEVQITGLGTFGTRSRPARTGHNPGTGGGRIHIGVDIADIQGREDAERCREGGSRVMTLQRQPNTTRSAADRLNVESTRLLCDDGHSAICQARAGKSQDSRRVDGWTAAGLDAASCMRQEGCARPRIVPGRIGLE